MKKSETDNFGFCFMQGDFKDCSHIQIIEEECFRPPWSEKLIQNELSNKNSVCFVCKKEGTVVGYVFLRYLFEEGEILRICVNPQYRNMKIASGLMEKAFSFAKANGVTDIFLEVRKSNHNAVHLYEKFGFCTYSERKGYYSDNGEDALLMKKHIQI